MHAANETFLLDPRDPRVGGSVSVCTSSQKRLTDMRALQGSFQEGQALPLPVSLARVRHMATPTQGGASSLSPETTLPGDQADTKRVGRRGCGRGRRRAARAKRTPHPAGTVSSRPPGERLPSFPIRGPAPPQAAGFRALSDHGTGRGVLREAPRPRARRGPSPRGRRQGRNRRLSGPGRAEGAERRRRGAGRSRGIRGAAERRLGDRAC